MKKVFYLSIFLLCHIWNINFLSAQNGRVYDENNNGWYMYFGDHNISEKWGLHTEAQIRRANWITNWQQLLLRTGINYNLNTNVMATLGYGYIDTYPYGDYPAASKFPEHRIYQQLLLKQKEGIFNLQHRYRLEQRFVTPPAAANDVFTNRFRYFFRVAVPFKGDSIASKAPYMAAYNEVFINFGENVQKNIFDQNRAYIALGYKLNKSASMEAGYLNQVVQKANGNVFELNHTLQLALFYNINFAK